MTYTDALDVLPEFQIHVQKLRKILKVDPATLRRRLGFTDEEIELAAHGSTAMDQAYFNRLGKLKRWQFLAQKKRRFESKIYEVAAGRGQRNALTHKKIPFGSRMKLPKQQIGHFMNYVLYNVRTGKLLEAMSRRGNAGREWRERLLPKKNGKYNPFLRSWLYLFLRVREGEKDIKKTNKQLAKLGLPPFRREHDDTIKKRYRALFLK